MVNKILLEEIKNDKKQPPLRALLTRRPVSAGLFL